MLMCRKCRTLFDWDDLRKGPSFTVDGWTRYEYRNECPDCGSEDFNDAALCEACEEWFLEDELRGGVCADCAVEAMTDANLRAYAEDDLDAWGVFVATLARERRERKLMLGRYAR